MSVLKTLYRRGSNFYVHEPEINVTGGRVDTWRFKNPGWVAFDFMCNVPIKEGELAQKYFNVYVNGVKRFTVMAGWAWNRTYIFVDAGLHKVKYEVVGYEKGDFAKIRHMNLTDFPKVEEFEMIEAASMPKPLQTINAFPVSWGWQRYQRSGPVGTELEFTLIFTDVAKWRKFMSRIENFYIISGDYGTYGGTIITQDTETTRKGPLILTRCVLQSSMTAGIGVDGL